MKLVTYKFKGRVEFEWNGNGMNGDEGGYLQRIITPKLANTVLPLTHMLPSPLYDYKLTLSHSPIKFILAHFIVSVLLANCEEGRGKLIVIFLSSLRCVKIGTGYHSHPELQVSIIVS